MQHVLDQAALLCPVISYSVLSLLWQQPVLLGTVGGLACTDQSRSNSRVNQGNTLDTYIKTRQPAALRPPMGSCWMLDTRDCLVFICLSSQREAMAWSKRGATMEAAWALSCGRHSGMARVYGVW